MLFCSNLSSSTFFFHLCASYCNFLPGGKDFLFAGEKDYVRIYGLQQGGNLRNMSEVYSKIRDVIIGEQLIEKEDLIIVAVSGGADSLVLLHILYRLKEEKIIPFSLYIAHLNHGLRGPAARADADFVRNEARRLGVPCSVGEVDARAFSRNQKLSLEDGARKLRYRFLVQLAQRIGAVRVVVGHQRDDQVETLLHNLLRGTGLDGLTGMKSKRFLDEGITLIRPMLGVGREEIERYCRDKEIIPRLDETNLNTDFTRNRIRLELLPLLEQKFNPRVRHGLQRLSHLLTLDRDFLELMSEAGLSRLLFKEEEHCLMLDGKALLDEHEALQGRILRLAVRRLLGTVPRDMGSIHVRTVLDLMQNGSPHGMLYLPGGVRVSRSYDNLTLYDCEQPCTAANFLPLTLAVPGEVSLTGTGLSLKASLSAPDKLNFPPDGEKEAFLDFEQVLGQMKAPPATGNVDLVVRPRLPGDRFHPLGAPGRRKLKSYLIDQKIPRAEREVIPLVVAGEEIIWVAGRQISHRCRITSQTRQALVLQLEWDKGTGPLSQTVPLSQK